MIWRWQHLLEESAPRRPRPNLRRRSGLGYDFPGMMDERTWRRRPVHQHMSFYGCAHCGARFNGPHAVYVHLAKVHDR